MSLISNKLFLEDVLFVIYVSGESKKLKEMLKVSDLKKILNYVDKSDNPYKDVQTAMRDPLFTEFVDECLKIVDPIQNQQDF